MKEIEYGRLRQAMVEQQIKGRGICNPDILDAFLNVRRHIFIPAELRDKAYEDHPLPIGFNQTISQPYIVGYMVNALEPDKNMRILEIGTGSGYQTAVISLLFKKVFSVEINAELAHRAKKILNEERYCNIKIKQGDGFKGWKEFAPFDRIIVSCAPGNIPATLSDQLADGGKMIIPAGEKHDQKLYLVEKKDGIISQAERLHVAFVPMLHKD